MSDRPTAVNGKRNQAWGTTAACPECGECLCFGCHPHGPCVDEHDHASSSAERATFAPGGPAAGAWIFESASGMALPGLHLRSR